MKRYLIALGLAVVTVFLVVRSQAEQGVARDEVVYMNAADTYASWWVGLVSPASGASGRSPSGQEPSMTSKAVITAHFGGKGPTDNNREHPPLMKTLFGLSKRLFHDQLGWASELTAYRLPTALMHGLLVALVWLFAGAIWGQAAGFLAALLTLCLPRPLFHAGLACFDAPMVTLWFATLAAYYKALASRRWCIGLGLVFGLALATKHNALMLPGVIGAHYLWLSVRAARGQAGKGIGAWMRALMRSAWSIRPLVLVSLALIGPLVLIGLWPWLWFDTAAHLGAWLRFHLSHVHYNFEYLGHNWNYAPYPWHVPVVTTLVTTPVITLVAAVVGVLAVGQEARAQSSQRANADTRAPMVLLGLSALVAMGPFLIGRAPIFGAEKHWSTAMPTVTILAGIGVVAAVRLAVARLITAELVAAGRELLLRRLGLVLIGALAVAAAAAETLAAQPYALSHYNALAGGAPGGADLGMNRQFWGYAARGVLPMLIQHAPAAGQPQRPVYTHDASPAWGFYRKQRWLPAGLPDAGHEAAGIGRSRLALVIHERHFARHDYLIWSAYGTVQPIFVLRFQGVPIVSVYQRP